MKIGVRPHDLEFNTIEEMCDICQQHHIDGLQLVLMRLYPDQIDDEMFIDNVITQIRNNGIDIHLLGSYFNMIHPDQKKLDLGYKIFDINTNIAKRNGIKYIGSETGSVNGDDWTYHPDNHTNSSFKKLQQSIDIVTSNLDDQYYLLEPVYDHVAYNLEKTKDMMLNDRTAITLDLANVLNINNYHDYLSIFESYLNTFGDRIKIFHFKNFIIMDNTKVLCALDKGVLDYSLLYPLVKKYNLTDVPIIVEELQGTELFESIKYIRTFE
ncbi:hypothetical protein RZE82_08160 [Mollicutes bacterium LVI A0039]|nr:hypothetical protein RZE82_08160 [Mollicutes bacterium LVI A0039]